jgi:hypothetical protein
LSRMSMCNETQLSGCKSLRVVRQSGSPRARTGGRRRGAVLLEVVVSLSILLIAMSVVGLTFRNGERSVELAEQMMLADAETERLLTDLVADTRKLEERQQSGYFDETGSRGMSYRVDINPDVNIPSLLNIDINIYEGDPDASAKEHTLLVSTRVQRVDPKGSINLETMADPDQLDAFKSALTAIGLPGEMINTSDFRPQDIMRNLPSDLPPEVLALISQFLPQFLAGGFSASQLEDLAKQLQAGGFGSLQDLVQGAGGESGTGQSQSQQKGGTKQ